MTPASGQISMLDCYSEIEPSPTTQECDFGTVVTNPATKLWRMIGVTSGYGSLPDSNLGQLYDCTAEPSAIHDSSIEWGDDSSLTANGTAWQPGTHNFTQLAVEMYYYGTFVELRRYNGTEFATTKEWSPISTSETLGDYEIRWTKVSGDDISFGPAWGAENVWVAFGSSGFFFSHTDTTINAGTLNAVYDISIRSSGAYGPQTTVTHRFTLSLNYTS